MGPLSVWPPWIGSNSVPPPFTVFPHPLRDEPSDSSCPSVPAISHPQPAQPVLSPLGHFPCPGDQPAPVGSLWPPWPLPAKNSCLFLGRPAEEGWLVGGSGVGGTQASWGGASGCGASVGKNCHAGVVQGARAVPACMDVDSVCSAQCVQTRVLECT